METIYVLWNFRGSLVWWDAEAIKIRAQKDSYIGPQRDDEVHQEAMLFYVKMGVSVHGLRG